MIEFTPEMEAHCADQLMKELRAELNLETETAQRITEYLMDEGFIHPGTLVEMYSDSLTPVLA